MPLVRTFQVFTVGTSLGAACRGIVVGFQHLVDERDYLGVNFSGSPAVAVMGKQTEKATAIARFSDPIQLLPVLPGASRDSCSAGSRLGLFVIIILIGIDHSVAEKGRSKISITGLFEHCPTFFGKIGRRNWQGRCACCFVLMLLRGREGTCCLPMKKHRGAPGFAKSVGSHINGQIVPGDSNVDQVGRDPRLSTQV